MKKLKEGEEERREAGAKGRGGKGGRGIRRRYISTNEQYGRKRKEGKERAEGKERERGAKEGGTMSPSVRQGPMGARHAPDINGKRALLY